MAGRVVAGLIRGALDRAERIDNVDSRRGVALGELCGPDGFIEVEGEGEQDVSGTRQRREHVAGSQLGAGAMEEAIRHSSPGTPLDPEGAAETSGGVIGLRAVVVHEDAVVATIAED